MLCPGGRTGLRGRRGRGMADGMKPMFLVALLLCGLAAAGCESLSEARDSVRERFAARNEPRTRTFSAPPRVVFDAVRTAAAQMGYRQTRGGPAQGEYEGISGVGAGERVGSSRQVGIKVTVRETLDGGSSEVGVRFTEILEDDSSNRMGMATESTMRDTPLYEIFFRNVELALGQRASAAPVK